MIRGSSLVLLLVLGGALLLAALNLGTVPSSAAHVPTYAVSLVGKYLCYAILALAVDLVWGYAGILSLGHAAFFALGGYGMGMYLMRQIGSRGQYGNPILPDFMVFLNWHELPWYWLGFNWFPFAMLMALLVPAALAFVFGWLAFRSRVSGVYLSIITQALTYALLLAFFRNDMGFGGNNGLTDFKELLGAPLSSDATRCGLLVASAAILCALYLFARALTRSRFGMVLIAVRDAESRTRFLGYRPEHYKLFVWVVSAVMAAIGGALYVPQVGIINPGEFAPANSIEAVVWVAVGGRGTLYGAILGAVLVNLLKTVFTGQLPELWLFALGFLFIAVTLFLPRGLVGLLRPRAVSPPPPPVVSEETRRARGHAMTGIAGAADTLLYLDGVSVSFDGFKALNNLSLVLDPGEMRAVIGPNGAGKTTMMDVITGKTRPDQGQVVYRRRHRSDPARRTRDRPARHRPQVPEADRVRYAHGLDQSAARAERRPPPVVHAARQAEPRRGGPDRGDPGDHPPARASAPPGRRPQPWPEAVARDRHAALPRPQAAAGGRAGGRHDRRRNRADRRSAARDQPDPLSGRRGARHGLRARARGEGDGAARRLRA